MKKILSLLQAIGITMILVLSGCKTSFENTEPTNYAYQFHDTVTILPNGTSGTHGTEATYVYFGDFPMTIKNADVTVDETNYITMGSNLYYLGSDGNYYAKCIASNSSTCSDGTSLISGNEYYFKVEPIKWCVVTNNYNGKKILLAENILIGDIYYYLSDQPRTIESEKIYPNNYKYSTVRAYLNGSYEDGDPQTKEYAGNGFLQTAFTSSAQNLISTTTVDNSLTSTGDSTNTCVCENTDDKIFLLSRSESSYARNTHLPTDFAKAKGSDGWWWLRSPKYENDTRNKEVYVSDCSYNYYENTYASGCGVCPAMCIEN